MHIRATDYATLSASLLVFCGLVAASAGVAAADSGGVRALQWLAETDQASRSAIGGGVMMLFAFLFGRGLVEMADRLPRFDRLLWRVVLIVGIGAGGAVLTADRWPPLTLLLCASGLAFVAALTAWRCRVVGVAGGGVFGVAALSALAGPAWLALNGVEAMLAETALPALEGGVVVALLMLGVPLWFAIARRPDAGEPDALAAPAGVAGDEGRAHRLPQRELRLLPEVNPGRARVTPSDFSALATPGMLFERLDRGIHRSVRANTMLAVLWVDVRSAPEVARLFGDDAGEELLTAVSRRLDEALRLESTLARTGKHSFAAVCEAVTDLDEVLAIMGKLREKLILPCELSDGAIRIDASFGHALFPQDGSDTRTLCRTAARRARGAGRREVRLPPARSLAEHGVPS